MNLETCPAVAMAWNKPDARRAPRIDVLRHVRGRLVPIESPLVIHDLSYTGFGAASHIDFKPGDVLDFRLESGADHVTVTARVVHSRPCPHSTELFFTGFEFVPGRLLGLPPRARIDRLIEAVAVREGLLAVAG